MASGRVTHDLALDIAAQAMAFPCRLLIGVDLHQCLDMCMLVPVALNLFLKMRYFALIKTGQKMWTRLRSHPKIVETPLNASF
jgi:hypothetical protein